MISKATALCLVLCLVILQIAVAWTDVGHVLTAEIARRHLKSETVDRLNDISGQFNPYFKGRDVTQFPYLATFMDDIKHDTHLFDNMHFIDYPYQISGDYIAPQPESINGIMAMTEAAKVLIFDPRNPNASAKARVWSKAFSLLLFVHVFGDVHQPLHAVSLFSEEFTPPLGDMGGNKWRIDYVADDVDNYQYTQMHLLFDCVGGLWCVYMPHPVTPAFTKNITQFADMIMSEYPIEDFAPAELKANYTTLEDFTASLTKWSHQSFELAKDAYESYPLDGKIDKVSIQWARAMLKRQIALAGYRMAGVLHEMDTSIYGAPDREEIPAFWRVLCIVAILIAAIAVLALVFVARKYRDYKQLAATSAMSASTNSEYSLLNGN